MTANRAFGWLAALAALLVLLPALGGCGRGTAAGAGAAGEAAPTPTASAGAERPARAVATAHGTLQVWREPGAGEPALTVPATTRLGTRRVLLVTGTAAGGQWLQVRVPLRPNGSQGWIRADQVDLSVVQHRVEVDLGDRSLTVYEQGRAKLRARVAVGTAKTPTPTGSFFVTDKLALRPGGAYGPYALGISAWSQQLTEFAGGDGQIGLHGTDRPDLLGSAASHGCVRVSNQVAIELAALPLGTPVDIRA